ncbi:MAG: hypothetical protein IAF38_22190 [Bacteroidia bacterium]|nr:hypothetical protein [Bacteroidia bacterium]
MKKHLLLLFIFPALVTFSQTNSGSSTTYDDFTRFDIGYEGNGGMAHNGWQTNAVAIEFEKSFKTSPFSRNYRASFGLSQKGNFYMHMPVGPIAGLLAAIVVAKSSSSNSCGGIGLSALLFILPDGFGFTPLQTDKMHVGIYANFLGVDYCNDPYTNPKTGVTTNGTFDYAPDIGVRTNMYFGKKFFAFVRLSGKYSTRFAGWGAQGTAGVGWDFDKN